MSEPLPAGATPAGLSHACRLMWEVMKETRAHMIRHRDPLMRDTQMKALEAVNVLIAQGADSPDGSPPPDTQILAPWELDTPEARELLATLQHAQALAEKVDAQRGNVLPDHIPTSERESRGTDYAESVSNLAIRLLLEVEPPKGRD